MREEPPTLEAAVPTDRIPRLGAAALALLGLLLALWLPLPADAAAAPQRAAGGSAGTTPVVSSY
ncbi:MAG: hypothetical protein JNJ89_13745 [Rubrivivax sp.]|nr:hypothetical protein [Rubrivivax sp.]